MVTKTASGLSKIDRDALARALAKAKADDDLLLRDQIARMLVDRDVYDVASFAAYHYQVHVLGLRPWQSPPCYGDVAPGHDGHADAAVLLKRLLDAGLSRWEPDPLAALAQAEARSPAA
jgi:hypothetical protein